MWPDNETTEDLLGFEIHGRLIRSIVTEPAMLPVTVGLFGDWGCGKSSVLKILEESLKPVGKADPEHLVIYFDTWLFEGYEDAKTAILAVLLKELKENKTLVDKIGDDAANLLRRLNWMKVAKVGLAAGVSYLTGNPLPFVGAACGNSKVAKKETGKQEEEKNAKDNEEQQEKDGWLRPVEQTTSDVKTFRDDFAALIKKTGLKSLIVIVDDLDRCTPERVVDNLEAIKLFLNVPGVAFVIAADRRIVQNAISVRYSAALTSSLSEAERKVLVNDYLEKLVQVPYTLPKLAPYEVRTYWSLLLCKKFAPGQFVGLHKAYLGFVLQNRYESFDVRARLSFATDDPNGKQIEEHFRIIEICSDAITDGLKGNPRQIKRFLNALWIRLELAKLAKLDKLNRSLLVKLMVLEYIDNDRFREVYDSHRKSDDGTATVLSQLESIEPNAPLPDGLKAWAEPQFARWLRAEPKLGGEDLRDYFWISRGSIDDAFAGVQLQSPAVRLCLEQFLVGDIGGQKEGVRLFGLLTASEKKQVSAGLGREALMHVGDPEAWEALFKLAESGSMDAAEHLGRSLQQAKSDEINLMIAPAIESLTDNGSESLKHLIKIRSELIRRGGRFGTAIAERKN